MTLDKLIDTVQRLSHQMKKEKEQHDEAMRRAKRR